MIPSTSRLFFLQVYDIKEMMCVCQMILCHLQINVPFFVTFYSQLNFCIVYYHCKDIVRRGVFRILLNIYDEAFL